MKKKLFLIAALISFGFAPINVADAKPAYCEEALRRCFEDCQGAYNNDYLRSACYGGCYIGYAMCGVNW